MSFEFDDVRSLFSALNDTACFPQRWPDAMEIFCSIVGASSAIVSKRTDNDRTEVEAIFNLSSPNIDQQKLHEFLTEFEKSEISAVRRLEDWGLRMGSGVIMDDISAFGQTHLRTAPSMEALRDLFGCYRRAAITLKTDGVASDFLFVQFPEEMNDFPRGSLEKVAQLSSFVANALKLSKLWDRKQNQHESYLTTLETLHSPIVIADNRGRSEFINQAAHQAISAGAPFFVDGHSRFRCKELKVDAGISKWFEELVNRGYAIAGFTMSTSALGAHPGWIIDMVPMPGRRSTMPFVLLSFEDAQSPLSIKREDAVTKFQLTPAEYAVAECLVRGFTLDQIVEARRTSRNTVKTQVRSILRKTGARSGLEVGRRFLDSSTMPSRRRLS